MLLYFDTGILRSKHPKLGSISQGLSAIITGHNYVELLNQLQTDFRRIKACLLAIEHFRTDWTLPRQLLATAFGIDYPYSHEIANSLQKLIAAACEVNSFAELEQHVAATGKFGLEFFKAYDRLNEVPGDWEEARVALFKDLPQRQILADLNPAAFHMFRTSFLSSLAKASFNMVRGQDGSPEEIQIAIQSYTGSLDTFVSAAVYHELQMIVSSHQMARNDENDLFHLIYLGTLQSDSKFVSDDKLFHSVSKVIPGRCLTSRAFL